MKYLFMTAFYAILLAIIEVNAKGYYCTILCYSVSPSSTFHTHIYTHRLSFIVYHYLKFNIENWKKKKRKERRKQNYLILPYVQSPFSEKERKLLKRILFNKKKE